jgi:hypothetical protein
MTILLTVGLVFSVLALQFGRRTWTCTRRGRFLRAGSSCAGGIASATIAALVAMLVFSYFSYGRLTSEQLISRIQFTRIAPFEFRVRLMIDGQLDQFFVLTGDEWQMDARLVTWKPPATILGLDPIFRLDRLSGRYGDVDQERTQPRSVHSLSPTPVLDVWNVARRVPWLLPGVDAQYGAATYVPMLDGALYEVSLSRDALIARPANDIARDGVSAWQ